MKRKIIISVVAAFYIASLFAPRDFDLSPYFQVVKPTLEMGFDHRRLRWADGVTPSIEKPASLQPDAHTADSAQPNYRP